MPTAIYFQGASEPLVVSQDAQEVNQMVQNADRELLLPAVVMHEGDREVWVHVAAIAYWEDQQQPERRRERTTHSF